jgi:hypothetical protein
MRIATTAILCQQMGICSASLSELVGTRLTDVIKINVDKKLTISESLHFSNSSDFVCLISEF